MAAYEKVVVVTRKTALEELTERFNTRDQARFYLRQMSLASGEDVGPVSSVGRRRSPPADAFAEYQAAHDAYQHALETVRAAVPAGTRSQFVDRSFLPNFTFGNEDLVVTLGQDGLVVNTAKYLNGQPLVALNPDPARIDGVLIPFTAEQAAPVLAAALHGHFTCKRISMAKAELNDGQSLYAVNDLFIGQQTHQSARYRLSLGGQAEDQSSSGIIVSTGAGSTGWFRSVLTGAVEIAATFLENPELRAARDKYRFDWEADYLRFSVREPFISQTSRADLVTGSIQKDMALEISSRMPQNGVIFSDGIEEDYLPFNSGAIARIGLAEKRVQLVYTV